MTNMQKKITAVWRNIKTVPQLCLDYLPTVGRQMEIVTAKRVSDRDNGAANNDYITTT